MNSHQQKSLFFFGLSLIVAALIFSYFYFSEKKVTVKNLGYTKEALVNPFLAAQLYLESQKIDSEYTIFATLLDHSREPVNRNGNQKHLASDDTLILANGRGLLSGARFDHIWTWVENGGTLITSLENSFVGSETADELMLEIGLSVDEAPYRYYIEDDEEVEDESNEGVESQESEEETNTDGQLAENEFHYSDEWRCLTSAPDVIALPGQKAPLDVSFYGGDYFNYENYSPMWEAFTELDDDSEYLLAAGFSIGDGRIYVLKSTGLWRNDVIQCEDNAFLLRSLINHAGKVWFLENRDAPSLFALMHRHVLWGSLALYGLIACLIWTALTRFGPKFTPEKIARRRFADHIYAGAMFLWKHGDSQLLIDELRSSITQQLNRRFPGFEKKVQSEQVALVARLVKFDNVSLSEALFKPAINGPNEFINIVSALKNIKDRI